MIIKKIRSNNLNQLTVLFSENNVPAITRTFHPFPLTDATTQWIACEPHKDQFYLALKSQKPVGFSMLRGWEAGYTVPSLGMFIDHRQHGKGYGKELLGKTIEAAQKLGCHQIRLSVYASNQPAYKIYIAHGFFEIERIDIENHGDKDQKIIMVKDL
jgi:ribosomal protein S18 acetylase RimI-like enzyme